MAECKRRTPHAPGKNNAGKDHNAGKVGLVPASPVVGCVRCMARDSPLRSRQHAGRAGGPFSDDKSQLFLLCCEVVLPYGKAVHGAERAQSTALIDETTATPVRSTVKVQVRVTKGFSGVHTTHIRQHPWASPAPPPLTINPFLLLTVRRSPAVWARPAVGRTPGWAAPPPRRCAWPPAPPCAPSPPGRGSGSPAGRPRTGRCRRPAGPVGHVY